jgi:hypothetical protein
MFGKQSKEKKENIKDRSRMTRRGMLKMGAATGGITLLASANPFGTPLAGTTAQAHGEVQENAVATSSNAIPSSSLRTLLPSTIQGFGLRQTNEVYHRALNATEAIGYYGNAAGNSISLSIADLGAQAGLYRNFIKGGGLRQTSSGNSFGLAFSQASLQGSANYGLALGQASQASLGQASGVVAMAQASQPLQFSVASQASQVSGQQSSQASVVFSQPSGQQSSFSAGYAALTASQVSTLLQSSGVNLSQLSQISQDSPFSLSQSSGSDGSYIRPFGLDTGHDVAGWELYDSRTKIGSLILGVNGRVGILIEATNITDPLVILAIASALNFDEFDNLIDSHPGSVMPS